MMTTLRRGQTGMTAVVFLPDSTSTTGAGRTGLTNASAGLSISVRRALSSAPTTYTGANILTIATLGTWVDPTAGRVRFREVDATNQPGMYELQFEDALFNSSDASRHLTGMILCPNVAPTPFRVLMTAVDPQDSAAGGLTNLDATVSTRATASAVAALGSPAQVAAVAALGSPAQAADYTAGRAANLDRLDATITSRAAASVFSGLTNLGNWLRLLIRTGYTDSTALGEINTGGTGAYNPAAESLEYVANNLGGGGGGGGGDPLASVVPGSYAANTAGAALGRILTASEIAVASPVGSTGALSLVEGDDYTAADGRALTFTNSGGTWPNLTAAALTLTAYRNATAVIGPIAGAVLTPTGPGQSVRFQPTAEELRVAPSTAAAVPLTYAIQATLATGSRVTLQTGPLTLTRP